MNQSNELREEQAYTARDIFADQYSPCGRRADMPELSRFGGMIIYMLFYDIGQHNKPHVHVYYGEYEAAVAIDGELLAGALPRKQFKIVTGWLAFHEEEAYRAWNLAVRGEHFEKIPPME